MKIREQSFKRRTVKQWALSYILVAVIPLFAVLVFSFVSLSMNSASVRFSNEIAVSYVQKSFEKIFNTVNSVKAEIIVDTDFDDIRNMNNPASLSSVYMYERSTDLRHFYQSNKDIKGVILFSPSLDWYISGDGYGRISAMAQSSFHLNLPQSSINEMMLQENWDVHIHGISDGRLLIIVPLNFIRAMNKNGMAIGVIVDKKSLFSSILDRYHDVVLYSERSDMVVYDFSGLFDVGEYSQMLSELQSGHSFEDGRVIISASEDSVMRLKCIVLVDRAIYSQSLRVLIIVMITLILTITVLGFLTIVRFIRRDWGHLSNAAEQSGVDVDALPSNANAYTPFVIKISEKNESLLARSIENLLDGSSSVTEDTLATFGLRLVSDSFYVIIVTASDSDPITVIKEIEKDALVIPFESDYGDAFIVNTTHDVDFYEENFSGTDGLEGIESLSVSELHHGLTSVRECFFEAISVHEYQKDHGFKSLSYSQLKNITRQNTYQFSLEENLALQKSIREGDASGSKDLINKVIERNRKNGVSPRILRFLLFSISGTIIRTINSLDERFAEAVPEINFPLILQSENFQKSLEGVEEIIDTSCYSIAAVQEQYADSSTETYELYRKVISYVHDNYGNSSMNVSSIADNFSVSIAYLSRIFKKCHRTNISEYITSYRLDRAKEQLAEGCLVGDVASNCGFGSLRTFLRVFRAIEGVTPGQYRESVSREG